MPNHSIAGQAKLYIAEQTKPTYSYDSHILSHHAPRTFKSVLQRISEEAHRGRTQSACGKLHILPAAERGVPCRGVAWRVDWMSFPWQFWTYAAVGGLFGAVGNGFLVMALRRGDLSGAWAYQLLQVGSGHNSGYRAAWRTAVADGTGRGGNNNPWQLFRVRHHRGGILLAAAAKP